METPTTHPSTGHAPSSTTQASSAAHVPSTTAQAPSTGHVPSTGHAPSTTAQAPSTGHVPSTGRPPSTGHPPSTTRPPSTGHTAGHPQGVALLYTTSGSQMSHMGNMTSLVGPPLAGGLWAGAGGLLAALACDAAAALPGGAGACGGDVASDPAVLEPRRLYPAEDEVARRWWALPVGANLQLGNGSCYRLLFAGQRGSAAGPDVRDAVFAPEPEETALVGDVEFHVRASDWFAHRHHTDARYNHVVLHVVLLCDDDRPTSRQDGATIPTCSLYDRPVLSCSPAQSALSPLPSAEEAAHWPCHDVMRRLNEKERAGLLRIAGLLRFEQKVESFVEQLRAVFAEQYEERPPVEHLYDRCLLPALAEALAYGRDRAFFRAAALYLLGLDGAGHVPPPTGHGVEPPSLDAARLHALRRLWQRAATQSATTEIRQCLALPTSQALHTLRALFIEAGLSKARADIVLCNVVLPFAAALGLIEGDSALTDAARQLYLEHPGLSSNRVIRVMCAQLQLQAEPRGSCAQQGLHHIYQSTCREKHCAACLAGKWDV